MGGGPDGGGVLQQSCVTVRMEGLGEQKVGRETPANEAREVDKTRDVRTHVAVYFQPSCCSPVLAPPVKKAVAARFGWATPDAPSPLFLTLCRINARDEGFRPTPPVGYLQVGVVSSGKSALIAMETAVELLEDSQELLAAMGGCGACVLAVRCVLACSGACMGVRLGLQLDSQELLAAMGGCGACVLAVRCVLACSGACMGVRLELQLDSQELLAAMGGCGACVLAKPVHERAVPHTLMLFSSCWQR